MKWWNLRVETVCRFSFSGFFFLSQSLQLTKLILSGIKFNSFKNLCNLFLMPHETFSSSSSPFFSFFDLKVLLLKIIQAQLIDIDLLLITERKGLRLPEWNFYWLLRCESIECISELGQIYATTYLVIKS